MSAQSDTGLAALVPALLKALDHTLAGEIAPEVTSANGKVMLDMVRRLLRWSVAELEQHGGIYQQRLLAESGLLGVPAAATTASAAGSSGEALYATPTPPERGYFDSVPPMSAVLQQRIGAAGGKPSAALAATLRQLIQIETAYHAVLDPDSAASIDSAFHGGKGGGAAQQPADVPLTLDSLNVYLKRRFPAHAGIAAVQLQMLPGGMGKDTALFELSGHPQFSGPLVMRKDLPDLSLDVSAVDEFPLLQAVFAAGVAAPEPLWAEDDAAQLGTRFIVVRRARGSVAISQDPGDESIRRHFADRLAQGLARIHSLQLDSYPQYRDAVSKPMRQVVSEQLEGWRQFWLRKRLEPSLKLEAAFAWLKATLPADPGFKATLVHGDYGFHNLIMDKGEVTAILDWEFSHFGDPAEDVNYCRQFIERYVPFDYFLERYLAHGGKPYDAARDRYFTAFRNLRNAVACTGALRAFAARVPGNIKMATAGLAYGPRFELESLKLIANYLDGAE
jgi:aminoglycoside phosphotransferase (APT) family kinase protein